MLNSTFTCRRQHSRRGAAWPLLLACLGLVMAASALAVDAALLWQARQELQVAADASALGAMLELADDQLLRQLPGGVKQATDRAADMSVILAQRHHVLGVPLRLEPFDSPERDFTLGFIEDPALPLQPVVEDFDNPNINALQITSRRTRERGTPVGMFFTRLFRLSSANVAASATAMLERRVIGFRPAGDIRIPLMPIGILSDPSALEEQSWEAQIDKPLSTGAVRDQWMFDKTSQTWSTADDSQQPGDGLPEMQLSIPLENAMEEANGILLQFGPVSPQQWREQALRGLGLEDLADYQGQLSLNWDGLLPVEQAAMPADKARRLMIDTLEQLRERGIARVWPLYIQVADNSDESPSGYMIRGFVAARIARIQVTEQALQLTLQPTVLITNTALTQLTAEANPYVGKVMLIR